MEHKMKIAVYTIALNEEQFVYDWVESAFDADYLLIADTGSTDGTIEAAKSCGINVINISIKPWRFDDARNAALAALPDDIDYCIALDMDEVLLPGWRAELEKVFAQKVTRPRYKYTWSWNEDGTPGLQYGGDKIHSRHNYRWRHPVHEVLSTDRMNEVQGWTSLEIHHHPDNTKSRSQYMPLLELSVKEDPTDDRNAYYYARELYFHGRREEAKAEFERHLSLPKAQWRPERAASMRYIAKCDDATAEEWLTKAISEAPEHREARIELATLYYYEKKWEECLRFVEDAFSIPEKPLEYLCEDFAWNWYPYDLAAIAAYNLGKKEKAIEYGKKAVELNPKDERLQTNLTHYLA
jgi:glycosyltransferase involved in cell wall biosynthesis